MRLKGTLALFVIAGGLAAYIWLVEIQGQARREAAEAEGRRLVRLEPADVVAMELPLADGGRARLVRTDAEPSGWRIEQPIRYPAEAAAIDRILDTLAELSSQSQIEDPGAALEIFGLDEKSRKPVRVDVGQDEPLEILLGSEAPVGEGTYAWVESGTAAVVPRILTVRTLDAQTLQPALLTLRDKRILRFDPSEVTQVQVSARGRPVVEIRRSDSGEWILVDGVEVPADRERISRLLADLSSARALDFMDELEALDRYGLATPEVEVTLATGDTTRRIALGLEGEHTFARVDEGAIVFEVRERLLQDIPREPFEYRYKQVMRFDEEAVGEIELEFPRDDRRFVIAREDDVWHVQGESIELQPLAVDDLLYALSRLDAIGVEPRGSDAGAEAHGSGAPRTRITLRTPEGEELGWVELGGPTAEGDLPARSSRSGDLWRVEADLGEDVPLGLEAFWDRFAKRPSPGPSDADASGEEPTLNGDEG